MSAATPMPAAATPTRPRRDSLGFPVVGSYARLVRLREGGWTGGVDPEGRPGPADILRPAGAVAADIRAAGYPGELGADGYPVATGPTGPADPGPAAGFEAWAGPVEVGGVYRRYGSGAARCLAVEYDPPDPGMLVAVTWETSDGTIVRAPAMHRSGDLAVLFSPSHPDDPYAAEIAWIDRQTDDLAGLIADARDTDDAEGFRDDRDHLLRHRDALQKIRATDPLVSCLDPQTPADHPVSGPPSTKETNRMSTDTGEATSHETTTVVLGALWTGIQQDAQRVELTINNLQAAGIGGDTITALYTVLEAMTTAATAAKTAHDTYMRTQGGLAEAASAAGADAADATGYYTGR